MPKHLIDLGARPLLDVASYARRGPGQRDQLSRDEVDLVRRTVTRTPEVMVKVLTRGGQNLKAVRAHLAYLNRHGELEIETDQGERLAGDDVGDRLVKDWDLDVEEYRRRADLRPQKDRAPPKLVHKLLFSMPPGTPARKVLAAVRSFAREEFGVQHRYAMVLHTDEPHPHVHMVVKAVNERGGRLSIRKETLRAWRAAFARNLRALGVPANATERAVRGSQRQNRKDSIYRAAERGASRFVRERNASVERDMRSGASRLEPGKQRLLETRRSVKRGWLVFAYLASRAGMFRMADQVRLFVARMPSPRADRELIAAHHNCAQELAPPTR
jgi:hypothetical protein